MRPSSKNSVRSTLQRENEAQKYKIRNAVMKTYNRFYKNQLTKKEASAMLTAVQNKIQPTALALRLDSNEAQQRHKEWASNVNIKWNNNTRAKQVNHVHITNKSIKVHAKTPGMNTKNTAIKKVSGKLQKGQPYSWPCPIGEGVLQTHQYTGAVSSTKLGNLKSQSNGAAEGYVPTGQLLYHSAGSGKTLLMLLTIFFWMIKWWAEPSVSTNVPTLKKQSEPPICNFIIFISETSQVKDMAREHDNFMSIVDKINDMEFRSHFMEFKSSLPHKKVVVNFEPYDGSKKDKPDNTAGNKLPIIQTNDKYATVKSWRPMPKQGPGHNHLAVICNNYHPFFKVPQPSMGHVRKSPADFLGIAGAQTYLANFGKGNFAHYFQTHFSDHLKGYAQLNIYLKTVSYAYSVLCVRHKHGKKNTSQNMRPVYEQLKTDHANVLFDFPVGKGAYLQFTEEMIVQLYSRVQKFVKGARAFANQCLAGADGTDTDITKNMTLSYINIHHAKNMNNESTFNKLQKGDFIRFVVKDGPIFCLEGMEDVKAGLGDHYDKEKDCWKESNKHGVSPFFMVLNVKRMTPPDATPFYFLKVQRMLINRITESDSIFHPLHSGDKDEVTTLKQQKDNEETEQGSNLKKGFAIYDIVRPSRKVIEVSQAETLFDSTSMKSAQQTLPDQALKNIFHASGAEMRNNYNTKQKSAKYELLPKLKNTEKHGKALDEELLWWIPYGTHSSWPSTDDEKRKCWMQLARNNRLDSPDQRPNARFLYEMEQKVRSPPDMPKTCLVGMTAQMALHLFNTLPRNALFIVDEVQKYIGNQDLPASKENINHVVERQNLFCMLSEAVKHDGKHDITNNGNQGGNKFDYRKFCTQAVEHGRNTKFDYLQNRTFKIKPGFGQIQVASATPNVTDFQSTDDDLSQLFRLIGQNRNLTVTKLRSDQINGGAYRNDNGRVVQYNPKLVRDMMKKRIVTALKKSKTMVSFVDLGMDLLRVPKSTQRGNNNGVSSIVTVKMDAGDLYRRKIGQDDGKINLSNKKRVEINIGYPTIRQDLYPNEYTNEQKTAPRARGAGLRAKAVTTKAEAAATKRKAAVTKRKAVVTKRKAAGPKRTPIMGTSAGKKSPIISPSKGGLSYTNSASW